jgi:hypothetical protein
MFRHSAFGSHFSTSTNTSRPYYMSNVVLLRAPSKDSLDRYESAFKSLGHHVLSVPVLETVLTHLDELAKIVKIGPVTQEYDGVIITSGRACEGWSRAVKDLLAQPSSGQGWCYWFTMGFVFNLSFSRLVTYTVLCRWGSYCHGTRGHSQRLWLSFYAKGYLWQFCNRNKRASRPFYSGRPVREGECEKTVIFDWRQEQGRATQHFEKR